MKITIPRLFDASRVLGTDIGPKVQEFVEFSQQGFEQLIRALRNNLTFTNNFRCQVVNVTLRHGIEKEINTNITIGGIIPMKAYSANGAEGIDSVQMRLDAKNTLFVTVRFVSAVATRDVTTRLVLLGE